MKRFFLLLLCLCLIGCSPTEEEPGTTSPESVTEAFSEPESPSVDYSKYPIPDLAQPLTDSDTVFLIPNELIESLDYADLAVCDGNLLISRPEITGNAQYTLVMSRYDLQTGELAGEHKKSMGLYNKPQIAGDNIIILDSTRGTVQVLDSQFETIQSYSDNADWCAWYLGSDLKTLYKFPLLGGIVAKDLLSMEENTLLSTETLDQSILLTSEQNIAISYVHPEDQLFTASCLNLQTGSLDPIPFSEDFSRIMRRDDFWFGELYDSLGTYYIGTEKNPSVLCLNPTDQMHFLPTASHLLRITSDMDGQTLTLYDTNGNHVSTCDFSDSGYYIWCDSPMLWSDEHHGYFFTLFNQAEQKTKLLFWKITEGNPEENLTLLSMEEYEKNLLSSEEPTVKKELYERATALSETYGVEIRIAEQIQTNFGERTVAINSDSEQIASTLDLLEEILSLYPDGFFLQLTYGHAREIQIHLSGAITPLNPTPAEDLYHTVAFEEEQLGCLLICADISRATAETFHHEISHLIEDRLAWDAYCRKDALFSETTWSGFLPSGFSYLYSTEQWAVGDFMYDTEKHFITPYSQISPMEDRAEIFEAAMSGDPGKCFQMSLVLAEKLDYYCRCIRDCFDTMGWSDVLPWEEVLNL